jgi:hypothetical protein
MPQPIKKSDIIEGKILDGLISEFERAKVVNDEFNKSLKESATLLKSKLSNSKVDNTASLNAQKEAIAESNRLLKEKIALDKASQQNAITEEKLKQQKLRTQKMENAEIEKEIKAKTRLDSIYMRFNDKLKRTRDEYRDLAIRKEAFNNLSTKEEIKLATLEKRVGYYDKALKKVDATMGMHQRNVGNYSMANGTLSNSVNQLTREMPAFGNSIGTGFMAISNNLPIFFDEIKKLKQANIDLQATGQPTQSILKQVAGSVFSVGTALSVGVTLLTIYGAKMIEWVGSLSSGNEELKKQQELNKKNNEETQRKNKFIGEEVQAYGGLIYQLKQTNIGSKERSELIKKINDQYGTTLQNLSDEDKFQAQLNSSLHDYIEMKKAEFTLIRNEEKRTSAFSQQELNEQNIKSLEKQLKLKKSSYLQDKETFDNLSKESMYSSREIDQLRIQRQQKETADRIGKYEAMQKELRDEYDKKDKLEKWQLALAGGDIELQKKLGLYKKEFRENDTKDAKEKLQEIKDYTREIEDERIKAMNESLGRQQLEIYIRETRRIEDLKKELGNEKQKAVLIKEIETNMIADILKLEDDFYKEQEKKRNEHMKVLSDQLDELDNLDYNRAVENLERINKVRETNLYNSDANDKQIAKITRQNQIDMLEEKILLAKKYGKETTDLELELAKLRQQKIANVTKTEFINLMKPIIEAEIKMSQKRVELLDKEMAKRQEAYNLYTELAKNGTIQAQQSLALEQQAIVEANKKKAEEMKRQERLKFAESAFSAYASNVDKGEKNPLLKTITDMTLLRQFISSMPSFLVGTEDTGANGNGVDGKGGFHAILHPNERVMTKEQNAMLGGLKNDEVAETIANVRSGKIVALKQDKAGNSFDLKPLLNEIQELKQVIRQKPETNIELGQIVQGAMEIVQTTKQGNTVKRNRYIV